MIAEDSRLSPIVESVGQVQPWGALSGVTIGYAIDRHCEVTLSWGALTSDVDEDLVAVADEPRTLRKVQNARRALVSPDPRALATLCGPGRRSVEGLETGVLFGGSDKWSKSQSSFGSQLGGGLDLDLTAHVTVGAHLAYDWMTRFSEDVGGRRQYRGAEFRIAAAWRP